MNPRWDMHAMACFTGSEKRDRAGRDLDRLRPLLNREDGNQFVLLDRQHLAKPSDGAARGENQARDADRR